MVAAVAGLDVSTSATELGVRVGIATGLVVVGDLIGEGASQESAVVGETPNLAARLQGFAEKNTVVISPGTHELASARFEYEDLGAPRLKGIVDAVHARRVIAPMVTESRFEATHRAGLTPLVGREHEIALLLERWARAEEGEGQVVALCGEPGIGKSRLIEEFERRIGGNPPTRYQCQPYNVGSTLHPLCEWLARAARLGPCDPAEQKLEKLESIFSDQAVEVASVIPFFAALLSIPTGERYPPTDLDPERRKALALEALLARMEVESRRGAMLLIFEDVHWADPTSLEFLELCIARLRSVPAMALITFRPGLSPRWQDQGHVTSLTLNRFPRSLAERLVSNLAGDKPLSTEVRRAIVDRTDGVPLFAEELTKTVLESGALNEEGTISPVSIPATLHDSLMARLDNLGPVKEIAQAAAVIGREFDLEMLCTVVPSAEIDLRRAMDELLGSGLVFLTSRAPDERYVFKHVLVQEAAYQSLLRTRRQSLHGRVARSLVEKFTEISESQPELVARHFTGAGLIDDALDYWHLAGRRAAQRSAYGEAVANLDRGIDLLDRLEPGDDRNRREIALRIVMHSALRGRDGPHSSAWAPNNRKALAACEELGDPEQLFAVLFQSWQILFMQSRPREARVVADRLTEAGSRLEDVSFELESHHCQWTTLLLLGELEAVLAHTRAGIALYRPERHHKLTYTYGAHDPGVCAGIFRGFALWLSGHPDRSLAQTRESLELARELGHRKTRVIALTMATHLAVARADPDLAGAWAQEMLDLVQEHEYADLQANPKAARAWAESAGRGDSAGAGAETLRSCARACLQRPTAMSAPTLAAAAEELGRRGGPDVGLDLIDRSLRNEARLGIRWYEAELQRVQAVLLLRGDAGNAERAEVQFRHAADLARTQGAKALELRAATNLARLYKGQTRHDDARAVLAPIYEWFTEGFDTADLIQAKALLGELV